MGVIETIPQFHLYGEAADDQAFDFIHAETIESRSSLHDWVIAPHSHRYLHQALFVGKGSGEIVTESGSEPFGRNALILAPPTFVHGFSFAPGTEGVVLSFTEDVIRGAGDAGGTLGDRLKAAERSVIVPLKDGEAARRIGALVNDIFDEINLGKDGAQIAMRAYLALLMLEVSRHSLDESREALRKPRPLDKTVGHLRELIEDNFRKVRHLTAYADWLAMTPDRLNEHCKRVTGVTAGHLIRQRLLTEAKRQLMFTTLSVSEIAYDLNFSDPSYFSRFFRKYTGQTPQQFREGRR